MDSVKDPDETVLAHDAAGAWMVGTPGTSQSQQDEPLSSRLKVVLLVVGVTELLMAFTSTATNIGFPAVAATFSSTSPTVLAWGITGFSIVQAALLLVSGRLADRSGRRAVCLRGLVIFTVASVITAFAPTGAVFVAGRLGQAVGAAGVVPAALALVMDEFPASRRIWVATITAAIMSVGQAASPTVASLLIQWFNWRAVYLWSAAMAAILIVAGARVFVERAREQASGRIDVTGVLIGTGGVAFLSYALTMGPRGDWTRPFVLLSMVAAAVALPMLVYRSNRHPDPLFDPSLMRIRSVWTALVISFSTSAVGLAIWFAWPLLLVRSLGYHTFDAGLMLTPVPVVMALSTLVAGRATRALGPRFVVTFGVGAWVAGIALLLVGLHDGHPTYVADLLPGFLISGAGWGCTMGPLNGLASRDVDAVHMGQVQALGATVRFVGGAIGPAVVVGLLGDGEALPPSAFVRVHQVFLVVAIVSALSSLLLLERRRREPQADLGGQLEGNAGV